MTACDHCHRPSSEVVIGACIAFDWCGDAVCKDALERRAIGLSINDQGQLVIAGNITTSSREWQLAQAYCNMGREVLLCGLLVCDDGRRTVPNTAMAGTHEHAPYAQIFRSRPRPRAS